jgi:hypothetical protein
MTLFAASTFVWVFILVPVLIVWVLGLVDIARRDLSRQKKATWAVIVILFPIVGTLVYFLLRKPTDAEMRSGRAASEEPVADWSQRPGPRPPVN